MTRLEIGLLGPLVVKVDGITIVPSATKQRKLLALLAVSAGREVGMSAIAEELWAGRPPTGPAAAVQTYVKQLRQRIAGAVSLAPGGGGAGSKEILSRDHTGYRLGAPDLYVDARNFEAIVARATHLLARGDDEEATRLLTDGLAMWRGRALDDVREGGVLRAEALRLDEIRLAAVEARIAADLRLGRHAHVISELTALTCRHPLQENLHAQLMLALYRSGRTSQALKVFRQLRDVTVRELGIEPSRRVQELHRWVLTCDPILDAPVPSLA
ncbi:AfsR/SARP family transcriptional regulator [Streptomyces sp. NPDC006645]|uniref:AfsR/SARP family transcriptional regulator n=1 Tax=unclassified Streptomyces TaxID=2593676 RepID=UPI0033A80D84